MRAGWLLLVLTVHATVAQAQEPLTGTLHLTTDLIVGEGETLVLGPGARVTGSARILVEGTLRAEGDAGRAVHLSVPIDLSGNGTVHLRHARVWGIDDAALVVRGGRLVLEDVLVEGNGVGLLVQAPLLTVVDARNATFRDHAEAAARLSGTVHATLRNATLQQNARNLDVSPADGARLVLEDARLDAPTTPAPSLLVRAAPEAAASVDTRRVAYRGGDVAVRLEGAGVRLTSADDEYAGVRIALSLDAGEAHVTGARFDTRERDVDAGPTARLSFRDVRFTAAASADAATTPAPTPPVPAWWALGAGLVLATGIVAWGRVRPRRAPPAPSPAPEPPPPPDVTTPLSDLERRILRDVAAHPGTAQAATAQRLGMTRQALHYHVKKLEARRLLRKEPHGRETRCTLAPGVEELLEEARVT